MLKMPSDEDLKNVVGGVGPIMGPIVNPNSPVICGVNHPDGDVLPLFDPELVGKDTYIPGAPCV